MQDDKKLHWKLGFWISFIMFVIIFTTMFFTQLGDAWLYANSTTFLFMLILILGKELVDCIKPLATGFSWGDIKYGIGGVITGIFAGNIMALAILGFLAWV